MSQPPDDKKIEIVSDEDWKTRVKQEDAAFDAQQKTGEPGEQTDATKQAQTDQQAPTQPESGQAPGSADTASKRPPIDPKMLPPANFPFLVSMFSTQAMTSLGIVPNPATGQLEPEPVMAKHFIDLLGVIETKTKGNLDSEEESMLTTTLHELRMAYMQISSQKA